MAVDTTVTTEPPSSDVRRDSRLEARYLQWDLSSMKRTRACGRYAASHADGAGVQVKASGSAADGTRVAGLGNVQSCGSVWACPVCAQKIQAERQAQVASALAVARRNGWEVLFLTLTMRHQREHRLKRLWDHLTSAWGAVTTGKGQRAWKSDREDYGIVGYLRLVEVTHGSASGWHVHAHVLLFCDPARSLIMNSLEGLGGGVGSNGGRTFTDAAVNQLGTRMFLRWRSALNVRGIRPSMRRGVDIRRVRSDDVIAEYFAKQIYSRKGESSTAHDVTGSHGKDAKNGNRTPFGILRALVDIAQSPADQVNTTTGELSGRWEEELRLWHTFETASKGRRQLLWSRGFRDLLALEDDRTDEEIAAADDLGGETVLEIPADLFKQITRRRLIGDLLRVAELDDTGDALRAWLAAGLDWWHPDRPV